jgi:hypothetical protein
VNRDGVPVPGSPPPAAGAPAPEGGPDATVTPNAQLPELDQAALRGLAEVGRGWSRSMPARELWERALPVDYSL